MERYTWMGKKPPEGVAPYDVFSCPKEVLGPYRDRGRKGKSVCVLGGGIAGLVAGYELLLAGHSVTIFEAQVRVGGRIRTWHKNGVNGEFGPIRIPRKHRGTMHYVKEMGLATDRFVQRNQSGFLALRGQKVRRDEWKDLIPDFGGANALFRRVFSEAESRMPARMALAVLA
jgi:monoamine oxidase